MKCRIGVKMILACSLAPEVDFRIGPEWAMLLVLANPSGEEQHHLDMIAVLG